MADFQITDKDLLTSVDRAADSFLVYDASAQGLKRTAVNYALDLTSHPVGIDDAQTLTLKTITAPNISSPVLSGTITGTYTIAGTPTFPSSVVTLTGSQTLTNKVLTSPTINTATIVNPTVTVDTMSEYTAANGITIDGLNVKDGKLNTNDSVVTANITNDAVTPAKWTNPYAFGAYSTAAQNSGNGAFAKVLYATEVYDYNSNYASSTYTAPIAGVYHFDANIRTAAANTIFIISLFKNGAEYRRGMDSRQASVSAQGAVLSTDVLLAANDTVEIYSFANASLALTTAEAEMYFNGHLVSPI